MKMRDIDWSEYPKRTERYAVQSKTNSCSDCAILIAAAIVIVPLHGWVIGKIWGWFLTGVFGSVPPIGALTGMVLGVTVLKLGRQPSKEKVNVFESITAGILGPLIVLAMAWFLSLVF